MRCVSESGNTHLSVQFDYVYWLFPPFHFLCSCFLGPELFGCWSIWMSILILFPTPFPIFLISVFHSLLYLFIYNIIFLILNFYLGCLSLNLQGLILVFVLFVLLLSMFFLFGDMFLFHWCSAVYYFLESNEDFFKSILFSTWSFFPLVTLKFLLEAFLR